MTPLHHIGEFMRDALSSVPLLLVRLLFLATLAAVFLWVLRLPRATTTPPEGAKRWDENLKVGALIAIAVQIVVYSWL